MKHDQNTPVLDQIHAQGSYERRPTDTADLAFELSLPRDTNRIITDFEAGYTATRDVGRMVTIQRDVILDAYRAGVIPDMLVDNALILEQPVRRLHERLVSGPQDQPIGSNFFRNATLFVEQQKPWAKDLDYRVKSLTSLTIHQIDMIEDIPVKDELLNSLIENPDTDMIATMGVYLAGRSKAGEQYLEDHFGEVLKAAKGDVAMTLNGIGASTGLDPRMVSRAMEQIRLTKFGSFDHLNGLVTSGNTGALGDYAIGSLRVEVQMDGTTANPGMISKDQAYRVLVHELDHASSAQAEGRCGLQSADGQGLEANEGMTEYLAQLSMGKPGITENASGGLVVESNVPYRAPVFAMLALHEQFKYGQNRHFATLFNAYHGDVRNQKQLEAALDAFYQLDATAAQNL